MSDLVGQIFQQVPRPTNSGLGQFYAQGVAAGQRNRQLDLQERQARLQDLAAGFQMRQYEAEQEIAVAQADAETQMGELMSSIYSNPNGFNDPVLRNLGFDLMSRLPSNSKLGPQFLDGITNARKLQQARLTMEENEALSKATAEEAGLVPVRVEGGRTIFGPPQDKSAGTATLQNLAAYEEAIKSNDPVRIQALRKALGIDDNASPLSEEQKSMLTQTLRVISDKYAAQRRLLENLFAEQEEYERLAQQELSEKQFAITGAYQTPAKVYLTPDNETDTSQAPTSIGAAMDNLMNRFQDLNRQLFGADQ